MRCTRSQTRLIQNCDYMPYKCYGLHSNEVLDKYFYYNPYDFIWMCCLTDTPACEAIVLQIEQQLESEGDLDFQGLLSDKVEYVRGHWVLLGKPDGIGEDEQGWIELAQDAMKLHSMLGLTREDKTPLLKPSILYTHCPVETYGECVFVPPTMKRLATE